MNRITITTNNIIIIGDTEVFEDGGVVISKPYSIQNNGQEYILQPLFEAHIGQPVPKLSLKAIHVLDSFEAQNNDLLQGYLKRVSGIELSDQKIFV